ncbi:hypothetical protein BT63DRAFT_422485 [Microthyrium microscopicum]|uniref:Histidine kinase group protein n=1 Tax=Microthyrium microscopicum TaxID=703497 RepID=A0A6A6UI65_9PEZI|nr:hypothetical protein BT63DRAFT_422485 [Microthyrium microscopicum]
MTKKKATAGAASNGSAQTPANASAPAAEPRSTALVIARNKHWRYISNYHGPWLQLPTEVLETIAHTNYYAPHPHPIDPAIIFDLLKIRRAVDEATDLAVRAASGVSSAQLQNSIASSNGVLNGAAALGLAFGNNGPVAKLSRERKFRMRELATQKLSQAYHLDEIAASVAMMQGTSTLEDLAQHVLQRNPDDRDAKYVEFFHEKIPSRMMAEYTPLTTLNDLIAERPGDVSPYRTRALTKIFKNDLAGATKDLSEALATVRMSQSPEHRAAREDTGPKGYLDADGHFKSRDWRSEGKLEEKDQPSSIEPQLLFHRGSIYLRIACQSIREALTAWNTSESMAAGEGSDDPVKRKEASEARNVHLAVRKVVKSNARKALRDFQSFMAHLEYTPGVTDNDDTTAGASPGTETTKSQDLVHTNGRGTSYKNPNLSRSSSNLRYPEVFKVCDLFEAALPPNLPPYPPITSTELVPRTRQPPDPRSETKPSDYQMERVTYHPLLTEALHSLLLCHALVQTPPTELRRHATNAARLIRLLSGFPVFLHARSTSRADWNEILRLTGDWIDLRESWMSLCRSGVRNPEDDEEASLANISANRNFRALSPRQKKEAVVQKAIVEALADERVVDEESFHKAVQSRESAFHAREVSVARAIEQEHGHANPQAQGVGESTGFSTERAEAIARWVLEAPLTVEGARSKKSGKRRTKKKGGLEENMEKLSVAGSSFTERE